MKKVIFGRTLSQLEIENSLDYILGKVYETLEEKEIFRRVPMHAVEDMHILQRELIQINMQPHEHYPTEINYHNEEPILPVSTKSKLWSAQMQNCSQLHRNLSIRTQGNQSSRHSKMMANKDEKRKKIENNSKENYEHFLKFSVQIDLGFNPPGDDTQDFIRRKKEQEVNKKIERQQADLKKIMNRKKMDKELLDSLIKDKKQLVFTYDYDGLLLPVTKLESSKFPVAHYEMNYLIDSGEQVIPKIPEPYHPPKFHAKQKKKQTKKKPVDFNLRQFHVQEKQNTEESSYFYKNFQNADINAGITLKYKGKQITTEAPSPNLDFFICKTKQPHRIQQKHYLQFIKNGNLKRFEMEAQKSQKGKQMSQNTSIYFENQTKNSTIYKMSRKKNKDNIKVNNSFLLKDLKMSYEDNLQCSLSPYRSSGFRTLNRKVNYTNPVDQFNLTTLESNKKNLNQETTLGASSQFQTKRQSKKIPFGTMQRVSTASKSRVRKSNLYIIQN